MKTTKPIASEPFVYLLAGIMAAGGVVSAMLTSDPRWAEWHLSRLGEGGYLSSYVFNGVSALCAVLMGGLTQRLRNDLQIIKAPAKAHRLARRLITVGFFIVSVCMMGIAVFPFDTFPVIHNMFGYSMTATYIAVIAWLPWILPLFSRFFTGLTYTFIALTMALFGMYFATGGAMPHLIYIEIFGLVFFFTWLIMLVRAIRVHNRA